MTETKRQWLRKHRPARFRWINGGRREYERETLKIPGWRLRPTDGAYQWSTSRIGGTSGYTNKILSMQRWRRRHDHQ